MRRTSPVWPTMITCRQTRARVDSLSNQAVRIRMHRSSHPRKQRQSKKFLNGKRTPQSKWIPLLELVLWAAQTLSRCLSKCGPCKNLNSNRMRPGFRHLHLGWRTAQNSSLTKKALRHSSIRTKGTVQRQARWKVANFSNTVCSPNICRGTRRRRASSRVLNRSLRSSIAKSRSRSSLSDRVWLAKALSPMSTSGPMTEASTVSSMRATMGLVTSLRRVVRLLPFTKVPRPSRKGKPWQ